jgi:TonB family protein
LGWLDVQRIRRHAERMIASPLRDTLDRIADELGVKRHVQFFESSLVDVPTVIGWLRPTILVPASALAGLAPSQMEAILAHELAHIRRFDYLVNGLQNVVETVLFYHPAVWWVSGEMRREREHCCDDLAVTLVGSRVTYAGALASLEESRERALTFGVAATGGDLLARVRRVLGAPAPRRQQPSMLLAAVVIAGLSVVGLAGRAPQATASLGTAQAPLPFSLSAVRPSQLVLPELTGRLAEAASALPEQTRPASQVVPQTTWEVELRELEERFRVAKLQNDVGTLALILDDAFSGTNQNGNTRNKAQFLELFESFTIRFISQTITGVQATFERAVVTGSMIEHNAGVDVMLFTRVWVRNGTTWQLLASTQFRDPQRRVVFSPGLAEGVTVADPQAGTTTIAPRSPVPTPIAPTRPDWPATRVGGDIREPRKIRDVRPVYPAIARANGVSGVVIIEAVIDEAGVVKDARILRSIPNLDQAALDAVLQWRYTPTILNGVPTAITMTVTVNFQLPVVQPAQ